jgi:hAT family C-terminal dimerisation region
VEVNIRLHRLEAERQLWRKKGAIGKLHNLVVWVRRSPQRRELFLSIAKNEEAKELILLANAEDDVGDEPIYEEAKKNLMLIQDNKTRWNSTYMMIDRALYMRDSIEGLVAVTERHHSKDKRLPEEDSLTEEDWRVLCEIHHILEPFFYQTKYTEGRAKSAVHGCIWETLPSIEFLLSHLERLKTHYQSESCPPADPKVSDAELSNENRQRIRECINNAWSKLDQYYKLLDDSPVYASALWLHPSYGWLYVDEKWKRKREWRTRAKREAEEIYEEYKDDRGRMSSAEPPPPLPPPSRTSSTKGLRPPNPFEAFLTVNPETIARRRTSATLDDPSRYNQIEPSVTQEPLYWWRDHRHEYPTLSKMAFDLLSIPAMSSECERVFSSAGNTVTDARNRISADLLEAVESLKHWHKSGLWK